MTDKFDSLIRDAVELNWPEQDWLLIKAQMRAESDGDVRALSSCGACGLMQLMPETADEVGVTDIFDPVENITGGVRYLHKMYNVFKKEDGLERIKFALAAYNAGVGNIIKAQSATLLHRERTDVWKDVAKRLEIITGQKNSDETRVYVERIMDYWLEYEQLSAKGAA